RRRRSLVGRTSTVTASPAAARRATRWLPRKPVAPVTSARTSRASGGSEHDDRDVVVDRLELRLQPHADGELGVVVVDDAGHHAWALVELDDRRHVRKLLVERRKVVLVDGRPGVQRPAAAGLDPVDVVAPARRAEVARVVVHLVAGTAVPKQQLAVARALPELARVVLDDRKVEPRRRHRRQATPRRTRVSGPRTDWS